MTYGIEHEPTGPGEILQEEFLTPLGLTQKQFADHIGCDVKVINRIVNGRPSCAGTRPGAVENRCGSAGVAVQSAMIRKLLKFLVVGSLGTLVAACYGVIVDFQERFFERRVKTIDPEGSAIPSLLVTFIDPSRADPLASGHTGGEGEAELHFAYDATRPVGEIEVTVTDTDGTRNGGWFETHSGSLSTADRPGTEDTSVVSMVRREIDYAVTVRVVDSDGDPLPGATVSLAAADSEGGESEEPLATALTDVNGECTLSAVVIAFETPRVVVVATLESVSSAIVSVAAWPEEGEVLPITLYPAPANG
jgi:hypothetical protein